MLFENIEPKVNKLTEAIKFQNDSTNRYINYLEDELDSYKKAVKELVSENPHLKNYFARKLKDYQGNTQALGKNKSFHASSTIKPD